MTRVWRLLRRRDGILDYCLSIGRVREEEREVEREREMESGYGGDVGESREEGQVISNVGKEG